MNAAQRLPGSASKRNKRAYRPSLHRLEDRQLMAIDLANVTGATGVGPYGVLEAGLNQNLGAGWSVAEVGDVNADGYDDFLIGAPTVVPNPGGFPTTGNGNGATTYLVFGSNQVPNNIFDYRNLLPNQRVGDLGSLGNALQNNPQNGNPGFAFNGLTFTSSQNTSSGLGTSVAAAGDVNGDGIADFMIGAPGSTDINNQNASTGRAYLIYGSTTLSTRANKTVDLDNNTGANNDLFILTFVNFGQTNGRSGASVAGIGDFIADGFPDVAIGAPGATVSGLANQGAVYVISGTLLRPARTATIPLNLVGQVVPPGSPVPSQAGIVLSGNLSGDATGFSVAGAGNTTGRTTTANQSIGDLLIGAPDQTNLGVTTGPGSAYLVYGDTLATLATYIQPNTSGFLSIPLANVGVTVPGATFNGTNLGDATGYSVSTAGDFNADGIGDFLIGSPGVSLGSGQVTMVYGQPLATRNLLGVFNVGSLDTTAIPSVTFNGAVPGDLTGFSTTATGLINNDLINEIAIGAPGVNGGVGQVYLIPGNPDLLGPQNLAAVEGSIIQGLIISSSAPPGANLLGASVSGRIPLSGQNRTVDNDILGDLIIGAPGLTLTTGRGVAGGAYALEGTFLPLVTPVSSAIIATIGIDQPFPPFQISATQPDDLLIYVFSDATTNPNFIPLRDIDPQTIIVNGRAFPNATIVADPVDENNDGLQDAIITVNPRSAIGLTSTTRTITLNARTLPTSPNANRRVTGTANVTVSGGVNPTPGGLPSNRNALLGIGNPNAAVPPFGSRLIPSPAVLTKLRYQRLNSRVAYNQFLPGPFFAGRVRRFYHGPNDPNLLGESRKKYTGYRTTTLGRYVFTRSKFKSNGVTDARRFFGILPSVDKTSNPSFGVPGQTPSARGFSVKR